MFAYYVLAAIVIGLGFRSLKSGFSYASYIHRELATPLTDYAPFASVIAPCRGIDQGLNQNLSALFSQNYSEYEIVFVTDGPDDPAVPVIEQVRNAHPELPTRIVFAGKAIRSGQKVHNLRHAVTEVDPRSEVLVFVDADARPNSSWLRALVSHLGDGQIGATTGYRWFISKGGRLSSQLLSVWNSSIASALGDNSKNNFCWGGSTAVRRSIFEKLEIREHWSGTVSDDFVIMRVLRNAGLGIKFVPACLTASLEECGFGQLLEFTTRQLQITRVYAPRFWKDALMGGLLFNGFFFGTIALIIVFAAKDIPFLIPLLSLAAVFILGSAKAYVRWAAVCIPLTHYQREMRKSLAAHLLLWPIAALLFLYNALVAMFSRTIRWRGISYELKSATEAVIISRE